MSRLTRPAGQGHPSVQNEPGHRHGPRIALGPRRLVEVDGDGSGVRVRESRLHPHAREVRLQRREDDARSRQVPRHWGYRGRVAREGYRHRSAAGERGHAVDIQRGAAAAIGLHRDPVIREGPHAVAGTSIETVDTGSCVGAEGIHFAVDAGPGFAAATTTTIDSVTGDALTEDAGAVRLSFSVDAGPRACGSVDTGISADTANANSTAPKQTIIWKGRATRNTNVSVLHQCFVVLSGRLSGDYVVPGVRPCPGRSAEHHRDRQRRQRDRAGPKNPCLHGDPPLSSSGSPTSRLPEPPKSRET